MSTGATYTSTPVQADQMQSCVRISNVVSIAYLLISCVVCLGTGVADTYTWSCIHV